MFRYVFGGLMVIAMASVASAGHKSGHSPGGGGESAATLGDLNCNVDQIARFDDGSGAWECSDGLTVNEAAAATAQSTANTAASNAADAQSRVTTLEGQILDGRVTDLETDVADLQAAFGSLTLGANLSPVLLDGNLEPIGTVVGVTDLLHVITLVEVQNDFGETRLTALQANWKQVENSGPFFDTKIVRRDVAFDGLGCTGQAFITPNILVIRITDTVFASAVTGGEWYVATSTNEVPFVRQSLLVPGSGILGTICQTPFGPYDQTGAPAEQVEFNIFDRFPLPYTLELR